MRRRNFLRNTVAAGAAAQAWSAFAAPPRSASPAVQKAMRAALAMQRFSWEHGILAQAFLDAGETETVILMAKGALLNTRPDGRMAAVGGGVTDPAMGGIAYWRAGELSKDPKLQEGARRLLDFVLKGAPRAEDGTLYHVEKAPEIWSDSFYTAPPFLAATGNYDEALRQVDGFRKRLWSPEKKLLSHMWDEGKQQFKRKDFWGVGNGWAAAGLTRVVAALPAGRKSDRDRMIAFLKDILDGCLAHQRADGLFHDVVDRPDTFIETNLAQMLAFSIFTGVKGGWLPASYRAAADRMQTAARAKVDEYGLVQGVCGAPDFNHAGIAVEGQAFFIMMEMAG